MFQREVFRDVGHGKGNTAVIARAGCGKTSTIVEALRYVPRGCSSLLVAFDKGIAAELRSRAPKSVSVRTLHSYGLSLIRSAYGQVQFDEQKVSRLIRSRCGTRLKKDEAATLRKAVSLAKGTLAHAPHEVDELVDIYDLDVLAARRREFCEVVVSLLGDSYRDATLDYDDMVWLPVLLGLRPQGFDRLFVDEAQDLSAAQVTLALGGARDGGRVCVVADPAQAVYGFRGADSQAVQHLVDRLAATTLPLPMTYRCGRAIVAEARRWVPEFTAHHSVSDGLVRNASPAIMMREVAAGDFILSRTNAPLVRYCLQLMTEGRSATIAGRDIGASLARLIRQMRASSVSDLLTRVEEWASAEVERLEERGRDSSGPRDRAACIRAVSAGCGTVDAVLERLERLYGEAGGGITLSTTHKAKGLERRRVWALWDTYRPGDGAEEANLAYVAVTRAREELVYVSEG